MNKVDKIFLIAFWTVVFIVSFSFVFSFVYNYNVKEPLDNFLTAASVAGFFGLIGSFITTMVQEYYKRQTYNVAYICKKSSFSTSIGNAIQEYYAKSTDIKLDLIYFENTKDIEERYIEFLMRKSSKYDGMIIRPLKINDKFISTIGMLIKDKKEIVLVDSNLTKSQQNSLYSDKIPFYVGSDFSYGGKLVAAYLNNKIEFFRKENSNVLLLLGPTNQVSAKKRGRELVWNLSLNHNQKNIHIIELKSFNVNEIIEDIINKLEEYQSSLENKNLIIFSANDNIAKKIMEIVSFKKDTDKLYNCLSMVKSTTIVGYDGIKDTDGKYILDGFEIDYATVDVSSNEQGRVAAMNLEKILHNKLETYKNEELVTPIIHIKDRNYNENKN